jgi:hypothetical protein
VHCLVGLHLVALEKHGGSGVLVTLGGCHHLAGFDLVGIVEHHVVIVWWFRLSDCHGFCAHPIGDSQRETLVESRG